MPAVRYCKCCFTQATHGIRCNVSASIQWLVVAKFFEYIPFGFSKHSDNTMANALLRVASMVNDSHEDFRVSVYSFDTTQCFIQCSFDAELCTSMLFGSAFFGDSG